MEEITYWVIEAIGRDGKRHELTDFTGSAQRFTTAEDAQEWADQMPMHQDAQVVQRWTAGRPYHVGDAESRSVRRDS